MVDIPPAKRTPSRNEETDGLDVLLEHAFMNRSQLPGRFPRTEEPHQKTAPHRTSRYEVFDEIARGGMGRILRSRDIDLDREVAMKVLLEKNQEHPELVERFFDEAQIAGGLQHPGIVPVYELGLGEQEQPFFTMKLVQGRTLAALLAEREDPSQGLPRLLSIFEKLCQAVAYAHARGVIHRDLKPSNLMVGDYGEVLIMDWGLAKKLGTAETSRGRAVIGTPAYMPPEQARGEEGLLDERADVFGLGAILCEILTGAPPFQGESSRALREQAARGHLEEAFERLGACPLDKELVQLARECLHPELTARPRHAGSVAERVSSYLAAAEDRSRKAELTAAEDRGRAEESEARLVQERRARRLTLALALAVLGLLTIGSGAVFWIRGERQTRAIERIEAANAALAEAQELRGEAHGMDKLSLSKLASALSSVERAGELAHDGEFAARVRTARAAILEEHNRLQRRLEQNAADRRLLERLEELRFESYDSIPEKRSHQFDWSAESLAYEQTLRAYGIDLGEQDPKDVAARIRIHPLCMELIFALRDWLRASRCSRGPWERLERTLELACPPTWNRILGDECELEELRGYAASLDLDRLPPRVLAELATRIGKAGDHGLARKLFHRAQRLHPQDPSVHAALGHYLASKDTPSNVAEAGAAFLAAVALHPTSPGYWYNLAYTLVEQGERDHAVACLERAIELKPETALLYHEIGEAYRVTGDLEAAIPWYRRAIELDPDYAKAWFQLGSVLLDLDRNEEAIEVLHQVIRIAPHAASWTNIGCALERQGKIAEAVEAHRKAVQCTPDFPPAHYNLGQTLKRKGDLPGAIEELREAVRLNSRDPEFLEALAHALHANGDRQGALEVFEKVIALAPQRISALGTQAIVRMEIGDVKGAIRRYEEILRLRPDHPACLINLATAYESAGRYGEALRSLQRLQQLGVEEEGWPIEEGIQRLGRLMHIQTYLDEYLQSAGDPEALQDTLLLAKLLHTRERHLAAARVLRRALGGKVDLSDRGLREYRFSAATSAVLVGCGASRDATELDAATRAEWRAWAHGVLQDELARWRAFEDRKTALRYVGNWMRNPALRDVREEDALEKLEPAERAAWQELWRDVEAFLQGR